MAPVIPSEGNGIKSTLFELKVTEVCSLVTPKHKKRQSNPFERIPGMHLYTKILQKQYVQHLEQNWTTAPSALYADDTLLSILGYLPSMYHMYKKFRHHISIYPQRSELLFFAFFFWSQIHSYLPVRLGMYITELA